MKISLSLESEELLSAISSLSKLSQQVLFELLDNPLGFVQPFGKFTGVHVNGLTATGAHDIRIRLEPSDFLLGLMAALRTGKVYGDIAV